MTQGIYTILNAKRLAAENGELAIGELKEILDATRYPRAQHPFLIELMRKFELCFRFPDADDSFLVPELLDKQEPELAPRFVAKDILAFEYQYPGLLPEGLLPRFIGRTSALSTNQARWRTVSVRPAPLPRWPDDCWVRRPLLGWRDRSNARAGVRRGG